MTDASPIAASRAVDWSSTRPRSTADLAARCGPDGGFAEARAQRRALFGTSGATTCALLQVRAATFWSPACPPGQDDHGPLDGEPRPVPIIAWSNSARLPTRSCSSQGPVCGGTVMRSRQRILKRLASPTPRLVYRPKAGFACRSGKLFDHPRFRDRWRLAAAPHPKRGLVRPEVVRAVSRDDTSPTARVGLHVARCLGPLYIDRKPAGQDARGRKCSLRLARQLGAETMRLAAPRLLEVGPANGDLARRPCTRPSRARMSSSRPPERLSRRHATRARPPVAPLIRRRSRDRLRRAWLNSSSGRRPVVGTSELAAPDDPGNRVSDPHTRPPFVQLDSSPMC